MVFPIRKTKIHNSNLFKYAKTTIFMADLINATKDYYFGNSFERAMVYNRKREKEK